MGSHELKGEYGHQALINEYKHKFTCEKKGCPLYPCYTQWFCERLSSPGKDFLEKEGAHLVTKIRTICGDKGYDTRWENILAELGEWRAQEEDICYVRRGIKGGLTTFKEGLIKIEKDHHGLTPQIISRGVGFLSKNIWRRSISSFTTERDLKAFRAANKGTLGAGLEEGAQRHTTKIGIEP